LINIIYLLIFKFIY
ncbi:hypothetical protein EAG_03619, partial [Camponotus floridanus]